MRFQIGAAFSVIPGLTRNLLCTPVAANPFIRRVGHIFWIRGKQKADYRPNPCRQSTQNAYKADFVDLRQSSRRKTKVVSFPPTFVFRPLTPPYVPFGIRRFLTFCAIEHSSPSGWGSLFCVGCLLMLLAALYRCQRLPNIPCSHFPIYTPGMA